MLRGVQGGKPIGVDEHGHLRRRQAVVAVEEPQVGAGRVYQGIGPAGFGPRAVVAVFGGGEITAGGFDHLDDQLGGQPAPEHEGAVVVVLPAQRSLGVDPGRFVIVAQGAVAPVGPADR
jgi:hypothetical protein